MCELVAVIANIWLFCGDQVWWASGSLITKENDLVEEKGLVMIRVTY